MIYATVHRSLLFPVGLLGLPRSFALAIVFLTLAMVFAFGQIWFLFVSGIVMIIGLVIGRKDPYFFDIYLAVIKLPGVAD